MTYKSFLWLIPFASFAVGYMLANYFFASASFPTPSIVGLSLSQATKILSEQHLNMRIVGEKADQTVTPETILHQQPNAGLHIKAHQTVFVVVAQKPISPQTPLFLNLTTPQAQEILNKQAITAKWYSLPSEAPTDTVIAQDPPPYVDLNKSVTLYRAMAEQTSYIMPQFLNHSLSTVIPFLNKHHVPFNTLYPNGVTYSNTHCIIREQRPLAGSLINLHKPPTVQLLVEESADAVPDELPHINAQTAAM